MTGKTVSSRNWTPAGMYGLNTARNGLSDSAVVGTATPLTVSLDIRNDLREVCADGELCVQPSPFCSMLPGAVGVSLWTPERMNVNWKCLWDVPSRCPLDIETGFASAQQFNRKLAL